MKAINLWMTKQLMILSLSLISMISFAYERIVVMSPDVGDVVVALDGASQIIGKDSTNKNPALALAKDIGMHRNLNIELILALKPDLVLGSYMVQPNSIYQRLNSLQIKTINVAPDESIQSYANSIRTIGTLLNRQTTANQLAHHWELAMANQNPTQKRYLLSYDGRIVAGKGTVGDELIRRAGGINAADNIQGLKPLSREGWMASKPDIIIIAMHNQAILGSIRQLKNRPEIINSPAAKNNQIYYWPANDFLRYGLDSPQILQKLHQLAK